MVMFDQILSQADKLVSAINPIRLFSHDQMRRLGDIHRLAMKEEGPLAGTYSTIKGYGLMGMDNYRTSIAAMKGKNIANSFRDYLAGDKLGTKRGSIGIGRMKFNSLARKTAIGAVGAYAGSNLLLGTNNPISNTIGNAANFGMHAVLAAGIGKVSPLAGSLYAGLGLVNIMRGGDNMGPF